MGTRRYFDNRYCRTFVPVITRDGVPEIQLLIGFEDGVSGILNQQKMSITELKHGAYRVTRGKAIAALGVVPEDFYMSAPTDGPSSDAHYKYERRLQQKLEALIWKEQRRYAMAVYGFSSVYDADRSFRMGIVGAYPVDKCRIGLIVLGPRGGAKFVEG